MDVIVSTQQMQREALRLRRLGKSIGFVPTMGGLHEGHLSLMRRARQCSERVVVSLFVNPIQFGPGEDLAAYPRDLQRDSALCRGEKVDVLFCPPVGEMYAAGHTVFVDEKDLSAGLCGAFRPGHFRGVLTVVAKLFNIVQPDVAVFGQKDAQQARLIEQMARDLDFPVRIIVAPTVRDPDGLAMSSRNSYLTREERGRAVCLYQALCLAQRLHAGGMREAGSIREAMRALVEAVPGTSIEYVEIVDYATLKTTDRIERSALVALCVRIGRTRLVDNMIVGVKDPP